MAQALENPIATFIPNQWQTADWETFVARWYFVHYYNSSLLAQDYPNNPTDPPRMLIS